ncbi:MAG: hypothetical protein R6U10_06600 [Thermoplasmatota archaeon]
MAIRKTAAVYAIGVGIAMLGMWTALIAGGEVDELDDAPGRWRITWRRSSPRRGCCSPPAWDCSG